MTLFRIRGKQNPAYDPTFHDHFAFRRRQNLA